MKMQSVSPNNGLDFSSKLRLYNILKTNPLKSCILKQSAIRLKYWSFSISFNLNAESKERLKMFCSANR